MKKGSTFSPLKGNTSNVTTRFPPEPSGYLHIGHTKAILLNQYYAQKYNGKLIVRMDDTNPLTAKQEFEDSILTDLEWLDIKAHAYSHTSDYFDYLIECADKLISQGRMYVDSSTDEEIKTQRINRIESPYRNRTIDENIALWNKMKNGDPETTGFVVRAKIDYASKNGCLRDPNMYRCISDPHYRTGYQYKVYPLYDFSCPIIDAKEGVTHALRSSEYHDRNALYNWVLDALIVNGPIIEDFSRLNFSYTVLSKRKLQWFVTNGIVNNWDDPSFPTVQGLKRRGLTLEALKKFIMEQGSSKNLNLMDMNKLWAFNKQIIDPIIPRYIAIINPVLVKFDNYVPQPDKLCCLHRKNPALGNKIVSYSDSILIPREDAESFAVNEEITLMNWGNVIVKRVENNGTNLVVNGSLHLEGSFKDTKKKINWVPTNSNLQVELMDCYPLLIKAKLEKETKDKPGDSFEQFVMNPLNRVQLAIGETELKV